MIDNKFKMQICEKLRSQRLWNNFIINQKNIMQNSSIENDKNLKKSFFGGFYGTCGLCAGVIHYFGGVDGGKKFLAYAVFCAARRDSCSDGGRDS